MKKQIKLREMVDAGTPLLTFGFMTLAVMTAESNIFAALAFAALCLVSVGRWNALEDEGVQLLLNTGERRADNIGK